MASGCITLFAKTRQFEFNQVTMITTLMGSCVNGSV